MQFLRSKEGFPFSSAVIHSGKVFETVLTGQPPGKTTPAPGSPGAEMREIFRQLDEILAEAGLTKKNLCSYGDFTTHARKTSRLWMDIGRIVGRSRIEDHHHGVVASRKE